MRGTLDPLTQAKIDAFARRRRRFILVRGICAVVTILLATMTLLAAPSNTFNSFVENASCLPTGGVFIAGSPHFAPVRPYRRPFQPR